MLKRKSPPRRKTRLRPRSKKREKLQKERAEFVAAQLKKRIYCEAGVKIGQFKAEQQRFTFANPNASVWRRIAGCWTMATELHEPMTRARAPGPETILDEENSVAICRSCHTWVHDNVAAATELGLLLPSPPSRKVVRRDDGI